MIPSFEIKNYRLFKHLTIDKFSRVNLITGKNNVGKTALLEALRIYTSGGAFSKIREIIKDRYKRSEIVESDLLSFFYYPLLSEKRFPKLVLESFSEKQKIMTISIIWFRDLINDNLQVTRKIIELEEDIISGSQQGIQISYDGENNELSFEELSDLSRVFDWEKIKNYPVCLSVAPHNIYMGSFIELWKKIVFTPFEDDVYRFLRILEPDLLQIALISNGQEDHFIAKKTNVNTPFPLNEMGDGMNGLLQLSIALINAKDGTLLIDEIENGIHYTLQPKIWKLILEIAENLNVQVFATTHSWDAVEGFQQALNEFHDPNQGQLIRLKEKNGNIVSAIFNHEELDVATSGGIELR